MDKYLTPAGAGEAEIIEKRSKFIARVFPVDNEIGAKEEIARVRAERHDARHNCWCYIIRDGPERYSDDGEPQGTAGLPMLEVFRRGGIFDVCCVVTRYFGGILLGPGGLSRAYSGAAKLALENAGVAELHLWDNMEITCPYNLFERVKKELESYGGMAEDIEYGGNVVLRAILPSGCVESLNMRLADVSAGTVIGIVTGQKFAGGKLG